MSAAVLCIAVSCQKGQDVEGAFARVGRQVISQEQFEAFGEMRRMYPEQMHELFPGDRGMPTFVVETEALFQKSPSSIKRSIRQSADWEWKQRYFPAQIYMREVIERNLGFSESELEAYYEAHLDEFRDTVKVAAESADTSDTAMAADTMKDSVFVRPLDQVKPQIATNLFKETYPPDSAFYAGMQDSAGGLKTDSSVVEERWLMERRKDLPGFFVARLYEEKYGQQFPDSLDEWYGEGKPVTPQDMEIILSWLPEGRRESYRNESGYKYLADWLLKWKLFSEEARETGFSKSDMVQRIMDWAWKYESATAFLTESIADRVQAESTLDTAMIIYAYWDRRGKAGVQPDSSALASIFASYRQEAFEQRINNEILNMRRDLGVEFLQSDWRDRKGENPEELMAQADSLVNAEKANEAARVYETIVRNFGLTETGQQAMTELAKVNTELGKYREAIELYRQQLVLDPDLDNRCNTFFMIGFIYDEHLNQEQRAEVNYKWILEHTPTCELADDAEFMVQHLGEPMTSVEDLRDEARRQGRDVEGDLDEEAVPDTSAAQPQA